MTDLHTRSASSGGRARGAAKRRNSRRAGASGAPTLKMPRGPGRSRAGGQPLLLCSSFGPSICMVDASPRARRVRGWAVLGEVAIWGKVVEHEDGYRAEHAMVRRLIVPARLVIRVARVDLTQASLGCLQVDDEVIDVETTEHAPEPGMAEVLARVYGVDVAMG